VGFAKVKCRDAHQNGLEAKPALRGKPVGPTRSGGISLVTFFVHAKKVTRQQAKKGLTDKDKISVTGIREKYQYGRI